MRLLSLLMASLLLVGSLNISFAQQSSVMAVEEYLSQLSQVPAADRQFVDVRTSREYAEGTILDAVNIDVLEANFRESIAQLDRSKPVYLFCRSGNRSQKAAAIMTEMGFREIHDLEGGYQAWFLFNAAKE